MHLVAITIKTSRGKALMEAIIALSKLLRVGKGLIFIIGIELGDVLNKIEYYYVFTINAITALPSLPAKACCKKV